MRFLAYTGCRASLAVRGRRDGLSWADRQHVRTAVEIATRSVALEREAEILRALAHPTRLAIMDELSLGEECVCHLSRVLARPQPYVSKQLAELRAAGLVVDRPEGARTFYRLFDRRVTEVLEAVRALSGRRATTSRRGVPGCPCPRCAEARCRSTARSTAGP